MAFRRKGILTTTPSIDSTISSVSEACVDTELPNPGTLAECEDELQTLQLLVDGKSHQLEDRSKEFKELRRSKEPLVQVKDALQKEITKSNDMINTKSEEVTQLKHKLRHHSENQIQNNIQRLELQLRVNNYKPKDEQKILDEISMLKRSSKSLKEFHIKQLECRKYRDERQRLIDQRNSVYEDIHAIRLQEDEFRRTISELKKLLAVTRRHLEHLKLLKTQLETKNNEIEMSKEDLKSKKDEKMKPKKDYPRTSTRIRTRSIVDVEKSAHEESVNICEKAIAYLELLLPKNPVCLESEMPRGNSEPVNSVTPTSMTRSASCRQDGTFYVKPKPDEMTSLVRRKSKKSKQMKTRSIAHPAGVLNYFVHLNVAVPKDLLQASHSLTLIKDKLQHFQQLVEEEKQLGEDNTKSDDSVAVSSEGSLSTDTDCAAIKDVLTAIFEGESNHSSTCADKNILASNTLPQLNTKVIA